MLARSLLSNDTEEVRIFYSYARKDSGFRQLVDGVLARFKWDVDVRAWYDGEIPAGSAWEQEILRNIDAAHLILLFITKAFVDSSYCTEVELPRALARHEHGDARVIPVFVERVDRTVMKDTLYTLQGLPRNGIPICEWSNPDDALRDVAQGIVNIIADSSVDRDGRSRWQIHLDGSPEKLDDEQQLALVRTMREIAVDPTLRPLALSAGSIALLMESSQAGYQAMQRWYQETEGPRILNLSVLNVFEMYGAGVQAASQEANGGDTDTAEITRCSDLLLPSEPYVPVLLKGVTVPLDDPLNLNFIIDSGHSNLDEEGVEAEALRLTDYFNTAVAVPSDQLWVNLSPDETNRMLGPGLAGTALGRELLESDLQLKKLAASLMHPDTSTGREFWDEVFRRARRQRGGVPPQLGTFQKVWITPEAATVYETPQQQVESQNVKRVYVTEYAVSLHSEDDYHAKHAGHRGVIAPDRNDICTPVFNELILPHIEEEVNQGKNFARFRQFYLSLILAKWIKETFAGHDIWGGIIDSEKPAATTIRHPLQRIDDLNHYLKSFRTASGGDTVPESLEETFEKAENGTARTTQEFSIRENREFYKEYMRIFSSGVFHVTRDNYQLDSETSLHQRRVFFSGAMDLRRIVLTKPNFPWPLGPFLT